MQIFGRRVWRVWLLIPAVVVGIPCVFFGLIVTGNVASSILGPPAIWNRPTGNISRAHISGRYSERTHTSSDHALAWAQFQADGTAEVSALPFDQGYEQCTLYGKGEYGIAPEDQTVNLYIHPDDSRGSCRSGPYRPSLRIAGKTAPYTLYLPIGDFDVGQGIWLKP